MGNTAQHCSLGLFQDSNFAGDLEDSKSASGGTLCIFGSHTFVPISWMCKKQTSVSHSSTESEVISLGQFCHVETRLSIVDRVLFQDPDVAGVFVDSKIRLEGNLMHFRESDICSHELDVQETNVSISQFSRIKSYFVR